MDYLQYNTIKVGDTRTYFEVLNLVINGLPSILKLKETDEEGKFAMF